jgi:hypothetical protein
MSSLHVVVSRPGYWPCPMRAGWFRRTAAGPWPGCPARRGHGGRRRARARTLGSRRSLRVLRRKRPPDGQPVPYRVTMSGAPVTAHSSAHRQAVVPPASGGLEQRYCLPRHSPLNSRRHCAAHAPAQVRSCPVFRSVTRRRQEENQRRAPPGLPSRTRRRKTLASLSGAGPPYARQGRTTITPTYRRRGQPLPGTTRAHSQATENTPKPRQDAKDTCRQVRDTSVGVPHLGWL